ncbi:L-serine ammonia-lyase [soil metagenome]
MEAISVFDIFKIGVGPSSSHTMGPWRAAQRFVAVLAGRGILGRVLRVRSDFFGSLAKTGMGHGTDLAVILGLSGEDPVTCEVEGLHARVQEIVDRGALPLGGVRARTIEFDRDADLVFHMDRALPLHPNALTFTALLDDGTRWGETYYSVGGGFVVQEGEVPSGARAVSLPFHTEIAGDVLRHTGANGFTIPAMVLANERVWRPDGEVAAGLLQIWGAMLRCIARGCHTGGVLPGGLDVTRRAQAIHDRLLTPGDADFQGVDGGDGAGGGGEDDQGRVESPPRRRDACPTAPEDLEAWRMCIRGTSSDFSRTMRWVTAFALAVNEENAAFGRVVTAPTNGAAGVIPAVMMYAWCFLDLDDYRGVLAAPTGRERALLDFMLIAGEIGSLFKKGATISAAMGGCQAEIGVSSAMAAAGLTQILGGSVARALMAAEIAMEHHLGMTCDPIAGLVQVPCIERNTMGAMKAITAAHVALDSDPTKARVTLDGVIRTMWATALDMQTKYKETSEGGLAVNVSVGISEC